MWGKLLAISEEDVPLTGAQAIAQIGAMALHGPCAPGTIYVLAGQRFVVTGETTEADFRARLAACNAPVCNDFADCDMSDCWFVTVSTD